MEANDRCKKKRGLGLLKDNLNCNDRKKYSMLKMQTMIGRNV